MPDAALTSQAVWARPQGLTLSHVPQLGAAVRGWPVCQQVGRWPVCQQVGRWPVCQRLGKWLAQVGLWSGLSVHMFSLVFPTSGQAIISSLKSARPPFRAGVQSFGPPHGTVCSLHLSCGSQSQTLTVPRASGPQRLSDVPHGCHTGIGQQVGPLTRSLGHMGGSFPFWVGWYDAV